MRGSSGLACLAAALLIGHALLRPMPSAVFPTVAPDPLPDVQAETLPDVSPLVEALAKTWRTGGWRTNRTFMPTAGSFAYQKIHAGTPLPALALAAVASSDGWNA